MKKRSRSSRSSRGPHGSRSSRSLLAVLACAAGVMGVAMLACSTADTGARVDPIGPDRTSFEPVAKALVRNCGTIDCHGEKHRNFRLYGYGGLRLPGPDGGVVLPEYGNGDMQASEVAADYDAVIDVEPEIMRQVVLDKGASPERLTLVRKARGTEKHKGNGPAPEGSAADTCLITWLATAVDLQACAKADNYLGDAGSRQ
jgi:hypothetical protein